MLTRFRFLARPFWRDYGGAWLMIGSGVLLIDAAALRRAGLWGTIPAIALVVAGFAVFFCAVGWSLWSTLRRDD